MTLKEERLTSPEQVIVSHVEAQRYWEDSMFGKMIKLFFVWQAVKQLRRALSRGNVSPRGPSRIPR